MAITDLRRVVKKNIKKAQARIKSMTSSTRSKSKANNNGRRKPATKGQGNFYHVEVRPKEDFTAFRTQDVGTKGHIERVAGKRSSGAWTTTKWLISKKDAHVEDGKLVGDTRDAKDLIRKLGSKPVRTRGDRFEAKPRRNVPERAKPTAAQKQARDRNIKKAQATRRKKS